MIMFQILKYSIVRNFKTTKVSAYLKEKLYNFVYLDAKFVGILAGNEIDFAYENEMNVYVLFNIRLIIYRKIPLI